MARAVAEAKDGDHKAREWLGKYLAGVPASSLRVEDDRMDYQHRVALDAALDDLARDIEELERKARLAEEAGLC